MAGRLALNPAIAIASGPAAISLPWIAADLVVKTGWGLVAPFAFMIAIGATLLFGGPWFIATRTNRALSSPAAYFVVGAGLGVAAVIVAAFFFDQDMLHDAIETPPDGGWGRYPLYASAIGGVSALISRLAGARWILE